MERVSGCQRSPQTLEYRTDFCAQVRHVRHSNLKLLYARGKGVKGHHPTFVVLS
jgi:hypothetical protein